MAANSTSICFVGSDNFPVLNPEYGNAYIGGESVQQTLLAKAFSKLDFNVSMVVNDLGQQDGIEIDNIRVWKTFRPRAGLPIFRFIHPRSTKTWRALIHADADIYYQSCAGMQTGLVALFCKMQERKLVFRVAHDTDCIPGEELIRFERDRKIYRYGLRNADLVVAQSEQQKELLRKNYGIDAPVVNMAVEMPESDPGERDIDVLWVNNIREFKRPDRLVEFARNNRDLRIVMIGGPCDGSESLYERIMADSSQLDNLEFKGFVPYHEVNAYYRRAKVFVNTSVTEGFPNSFLQSWIRGTPVVSFFDPDGVIEREGLGASPRDLTDMGDKVRELINNAEKYVSLSSNAKSFAQKHFSAISVARDYITHFSRKGLG